MSLLLQALQKAAKDRESVQPDMEVSRSGLDLEPGEIQPVAMRAGTASALGELPASGGGPDEPKPSPQQAAAVLGAEAREAPARRLPGFSLRPVPLVAGAAAVLMAGYGVYVYIAMSNPGMLAGTSGSTTRQPPPMAVRHASPPGSPQAATPGPDVLQTPAQGPSPAAAQANGAPELAKVAPSAAAEGSPGAAESGPHASANLSLSSADDLATIPAAGLRAPAARKRTAAPVREEQPVAEASRPERPKARAAGAVPVMPDDDRVKVRATESPRGIGARIEEAWTNAQRGRLAEAEAIYESVLAMDPRNIDALLGLASIAWRQGRTERAGEFYGRVVDLDPQNTAAHSGLIGLLGMTDPVASESRLREMIAREPSGQLFFTLGNLHARQAQWAQAQRAYFQAFQTEPGNPDYAFNLAVSLDRLGQAKPALQYYRKAMEQSLAQGRAGFDQKAAVARIAQLALSEDGAQ